MIPTHFVLVHIIYWISDKLNPCLIQKSILKSLVTNLLACLVLYQQAKANLSKALLRDSTLFIWLVTIHPSYWSKTPESIYTCSNTVGTLTDRSIYIYTCTSLWSIDDQVHINMDRMNTLGMYVHHTHRHEQRRISEVWLVPLLDDNILAW